MSLTCCPTYCQNCRTIQQSASFTVILHTSFLKNCETGSRRKSQSFREGEISSKFPSNGGTEKSNPCLNSAEFVMVRGRRKFQPIVILMANGCNGFTKVSYES